MSDPSMSSLMLRLIFRSLGAGHPIRLAVGVAFGIALKIAADVLSASYPESAALKTVAAYQSIWFIILCAPLVFVPIVFGKRSAPESAVHTINTIQALLDRAKLSRLGEQLFWRALLDKYVAAAKPDLRASPNMDDLFRETAKETLPNDAAPS
jgi:hypothetical protein